MTKPLSISKLREKLDRLLSMYVRIRDFSMGCISCGEHVAWDEFEAGHYHDRSVAWAAVYFHPKNVNGQCRNCNQYRNGAKPEYAAGLVKRYGGTVLRELEELQQRRDHWSVIEYQDAIEKLKTMGFK